MAQILGQASFQRKRLKVKKLIRAQTGGLYSPVECLYLNEDVDVKDESVEPWRQAVLLERRAWLREPAFALFDDAFFAP